MTHATVEASPIPDSSTSSPAGGVDTKTVEDRRTLHFTTLADILADAEAFAATGEPRTSGNWSVGEVVDHVRMIMTYSREGFPDMGIPAPLRWFTILFMKKRTLAKGFDAGFKFPTAKIAAAFTPERVSLDVAMTRLRREVELSSVPGAMSQPSPLVGRLTHDEWQALQCRHAELHFSFVFPATAGDA
ncbi:MAG: DUF1569 domain-containing protein [Planctomycetota bacterium]